jgi:hypothetical protein
MHLGLNMLRETRNLHPDAAVELLHETATRALAGEFEPVVPMSAPEWPPLPDYLVRDLDGRSIYTRPGSERFATRVQLTLEERLINQAQRHGAPCLSRYHAAALIGADARTLDAQLRAQARGTAEYGLWSTAHSAQGRTVTTAIALVTGTEDAQWLYSAMTRGAKTNLACVFTHAHQDRAETSPRSRPDPELARNALIAAERNADQLSHRDLDTPVGIEPKDKSAVLASILERDGRQRSALAERRANLINADHLGRLAAIWEGETADLRLARYRQAIETWLPAGTESALDSYQATWLGAQCAQPKSAAAAWTSTAGANYPCGDGTGRPAASSPNSGATATTTSPTTHPTSGSRPRPGNSPRCPQFLRSGLPKRPANPLASSFLVQQMSD